jgi:hypothetical protein
MAEILIFGGLAIIAELEFAGLLNWQRFAAKRPGYTSPALRPFAAAE